MSNLVEFAQQVGVPGGFTYGNAFAQKLLGAPAGNTRLDTKNVVVRHDTKSSMLGLAEVKKLMFFICL